MRTVKQKVRRIQLYKVEGWDYRRGHSGGPDLERQKVIAALDMLRYDHAFACDEYPDIVMFIDAGDYRSRITTERWRSFGQYLTEIKTDTKVLSFDLDKWFTVRDGQPVLARDEKNYNGKIEYTFPLGFYSAEDAIADYRNDFEVKHQ